MAERNNVRKTSSRLEEQHKNRPEKVIKNGPKGPPEQAKPKNRKQSETTNSRFEVTIKPPQSR